MRQQIDYKDKLTQEDMDRFYLFHEDSLRKEGIGDFGEWWHKAETGIPRRFKDHEDLFVRMQRCLKKFRIEGINCSETMNAIQDWYVCCCEINVDLKNRGFL